MATAGRLEDHLSFPVCMDVYKDPYVLKCLHTCCYECINQLTQQYKIKCPQCRNICSFREIKQDFKMKALVDFYHCQNVNKTAIERKQTVSNCEVCNKTENPLSSECVDCNQFMCSVCEAAHGRINTCKNHHVISVQEKIQKLQNSFSKHLENFTSENDTLLQKMSELDKKEVTISDSYVEKISDIQDACEKYHEEIDEWETELTHDIKKRTMGLLSTIADRKEIAQVCKLEIDTKSCVLSEMIETADWGTLTETCKSMNCDADLKIINRKIKKLDIGLVSPLKLGFKELNLKDILHTSSGRQSYIAAVANQYTRIANRTYIKQCEIPLDNPRSQFELINGDIWIGNDGCINVYNDQCQHTRTVHLKMLKDIIRVNQSINGSIFVATDGGDNCGIHQLDIMGKYISQVVHGLFASIYCFKNLVIAYEYDQDLVMTFRCKMRSVIKIKQFCIPNTQSSVLDRIAVNKDFIYISMINNRCINVYSHDGQYLRVLEKTLFSLPYICDCDYRNIIVSDMHKNSLLVYSDEEKLHKLSLPYTDKPVHCVVHNSGETIWVLLLEHKKIVKYTAEPYKSLNKSSSHFSETYSYF